MADGDGDDFVLHRTGISINIDNRHTLLPFHDLNSAMAHQD
jgi:hypothetical protein